jgi:two-component system chemotaxis response regulator CheB
VSTRPSRILIVDDSAVMRRLLNGALKADPEIEVVAEAADVFSANDLIAKHRPDVVTLDVEMPRMDGLAFLRHLMRHNPTAVIVVSSYTPEGSAASIEALRAGAVDVIPKPANPQAVAAFAGRLRRRVRELRACGIRLRPRGDDAPVDRGRMPFALGRTVNALVAIGASTGGPSALERVLAGVPADSPPILIVQHMPAHFTRLFAKHLDGTSAVRVVEAAQHQELRAGTAYLAPGDYHMTVDRRDGALRTVLRRGAAVHRQRPSVDVLFESLTGLQGIPIVGVLLTGMGDDGADGMVALRRAGHQTIAEDEQSCVVFGMPREAIARGGASHTVPLERIPFLIADCLTALTADSAASKHASALTRRRRQSS